MPRAASLLIVVSLWAALYLPFLGLSELRGEEGKRVMPAIQMLDSGNYLVPYLGAHPYLNKPPLVSWLVAASFRAFGIRSEWTARLPSAASILLVALVLVTVGRVSLGATGSMIAAVCWLTSLEVIAKGRVIETDAINASFFALALISWLSFWQQQRSPWLTFTVPWVFLALGFLTKGPGILLFYYLILIAVTWRTGRLRALIHPAHFIGILIMSVVFAAWVIPFFLTIHPQSVGQVWSEEFTAILFGEKGNSENWLLNLPRGLAFFLPWILLIPFLRFHKFDDVAVRETVRGLVLGSAIPFLIVVLLPGGSPRYILPLVASWCWVVAMANNAFEWRVGIKHFQIGVSRQLVKAVIVIAIGVELIVLPIRTARKARGHKVLKPAAAEINKAMPQKESICAVDLPYEPYLFYVRAPVSYFSTLEELPTNARFLLIQSRDLPKMETNARWTDLQPKLLARTAVSRSNDTMLFHVTANPPNQ